MEWRTTIYTLDAEVEGAKWFRVPRNCCYIVRERKTLGLYSNCFEWIRYSYIWVFASHILYIIAIAIFEWIRYIRVNSLYSNGFKWELLGRRVIRTIIGQCVTCRKVAAKRVPEIHTDLRYSLLGREATGNNSRASVDTRARLSPSRFTSSFSHSM